jgi:conjugal transfer pilus assembly protein TraE
MDRARYDSALDDTRLRLRSWQRAALGLIAVDLLLTLRVVSFDTREKTVVVPAALSQSFWVQGDEVSPAYVETMGRYFAGLMLTYSPTSFSEQKQIVLRYADPEAHGPLEAQLTADEDKIRRNRVSQVFYIAQTRLRPDARSLAFSGDLATFVGQEPLSPRHATFVLRLTQRDGQLYVASFQEAHDESDPFGDRDRPADGRS